MLTLKQIIRSSVGHRKEGAQYVRLVQVKKGLDHEEF
jgi:hypothetical protein